MTIDALLAEIERLDNHSTQPPWDICVGSYSTNSQLFSVFYKEGIPHISRVLARFGPNVNASEMFLHNNDAEFCKSARTLLPLCARLLRIYGKYADGRMDAHDVANCTAELSDAMKEEGR